MAWKFNPFTRKFDKTDPVDATDLASTIHGATGKTTPVDADELGLIDSAASNALKKLTWTTLRATLKAYFDTLYSVAGAIFGSTGSTDNAVLRANGTGGKTAQASGVTIDDSDNVTVPGSVSAGLSTVVKTSTGSLTNQECLGTILSNYGMSGATDTTLYAVDVSGTLRPMMTVMVETAGQTWSLKPPTGEAFVLDGVALDANDEIDCGQVRGDFLTLVRVRTGAATGQWYAYSGQGAWTDGGGS